MLSSGSALVALMLFHLAHIMCGIIFSSICSFVILLIAGTDILILYTFYSMLVNINMYSKFGMNTIESIQLIGQILISYN